MNYLLDYLVSLNNIGDQLLRFSIHFYALLLCNIFNLTLKVSNLHDSILDSAFEEVWGIKWKKLIADSF